jgi:hypothetical protein
VFKARRSRKVGEESILKDVIGSMIEKGPNYCRGVRLGFLSVIGARMPEGYDIDLETKQLIVLR